MNARTDSTVASPIRGRLFRLDSWKIALVAIPFACAAIGLEFSWFHGRQEARVVARANERVVEKIAAARGNMAEQHWNEAIRHLEDALAEERASNRAEVDPVLEEAQHGQAETLLQTAHLALTRKETNDALRLLRAYLAHPQAAQLERARRLRDDLERAVSDDEAALLLARLSDEALTVFAEKGQLTEDDGLHTTAARTLFLETLRRNVPKEMRRREARREVARLTEEHRAAERIQRIARLRDTPTFQSLTAFLTRTREQSRTRQQLAEQREAELARLFEELGVQDAAEQERFRADLLERDAPSTIREQVERRRADSKRAYRDARESTPADRELFDLLVDREVDDFLKMLPPL